MTIVREEKPVIYRDWHRHWYRVADFVQPQWLRFLSSRTGRFFAFVARVSLPVLRVALRVAMWVTVAAVVVGFGVLYVALSFALGNGKVAGAISRANR
jgi:hypothetical protein